MRFLVREVKTALKPHTFSALLCHTFPNLAANPHGFILFNSTPSFMKNLVSVLIFVALLFSPLQAFANEADQHDVVLNEEAPANPGNDSEEIIEIPNRNRLPARKIMCEISRENGVVIYQSGIADEIVSYEIYDITGSNIAIFSDEQSFIDFIFSGISGEFQIRFRTDSASYSGYIEL